MPDRRTMREPLAVLIELVECSSTSRPRTPRPRRARELTPSDSGSPTLATHSSPSQRDARGVSNSAVAASTVRVADLLERLRARDFVGEREQRLGALGLAPLLLVEARILERDRRVAGEHLEQADVVLVELVEAELRDDDRAGDPRAVPQRHGGEGLLDLFGARDPVGELALERVRHEQRLAGLGDPAGDAHRRPSSYSVRRSVPCAGVEVADERDRAQLVAVAQERRGSCGNRSAAAARSRSSRRSRCTSFSRFSLPASDCSIFMCAIERTSRPAVTGRRRALGRAVVVEDGLVLAARLRGHHRRLGAGDSSRGFIACCGPCEMPIDTVIGPAGSNSVSSQPLGEPRRQAEGAPASHDGMITPNSSPPMRQTTSEPRTVSRATRADLHEQLVAGAVPVDVVHALEVVEVEHQHRDRVARAGGARQLGRAGARGRSGGCRGR